MVSAMDTQADSLEAEMVNHPGWISWMVVRRTAFLTSLWGLDPHDEVRRDVTGLVQALEVPLSSRGGRGSVGETVEVAGGGEPVQEGQVDSGDVGERAHVDVVNSMFAVVQDVVAGGAEDVDGHERAVHDHRTESCVRTRKLDRHHLAQAEEVVLLPGRFSQQVRVAVDRRDHVVVGVEHGW